MSELFWNNQTKSQKEEYIEMLKILGSLSNLFSDSNSPYLYYRAHENLFCASFDAKNLSRGDVSYDAIKDRVGIGLKTFLQNNGRTYQKVAEFNGDSDKLRKLKSHEEIVYMIAELRNKRIEVTQNITDATDSVYHLITREPGKMNVFETPLDLVDINSIRIQKKQSKNTIRFTDKYNEYSYSLSKNTLLKRFYTQEQNKIVTFDVDILENPFELLKSMQVEIADSRLISESKENHIVLPFEIADSRLISESKENYIVLPLYSPNRGDVPQRSGLNQWNAQGRVRHPDEVYIPIPTWIHDTFDTFFAYAKQRKVKGESAKNSPTFQVELPNGDVMKCKVAQSGGKALMSDPNKDLGRWILRDVLKIAPNHLVNMSTLNEIGIDSVKLTKKAEDYYLLDFMETGSYTEFKEENA